jgi:hypothetical protein
MAEPQRRILYNMINYVDHIVLQPYSRILITLYSSWVKVIEQNITDH